MRNASPEGRRRDQATRFAGGFLTLSAWRSRSLIRDCHPGPAARRAASTSGSRRTLICCFAAADFGRPRPRRGASAVARRRNLPLASLDQELRAAGTALGVPLLGDERPHGGLTAACRSGA